MVAKDANSKLYDMSELWKEVNQAAREGRLNNICTHCDGKADYQTYLYKLYPDHVFFEKHHFLKKICERCAWRFKMLKLESNYEAKRRWAARGAIEREVRCISDMIKDPQSDFDKEFGGYITTDGEIIFLPLNLSIRESRTPESR